MVGKFRKGFTFAFFASQEPFTKIKAANFIGTHVHPASESRHYLKLYLTPVSKCAFDGYCSSHSGNRSFT